MPPREWCAWTHQIKTVIDLQGLLPLYIKYIQSKKQTFPPLFIGVKKWTGCTECYPLTPTRDWNIWHKIQIVGTKRIYLWSICIWIIKFTSVLKLWSGHKSDAEILTFWPHSPVPNDLLKSWDDDDSAWNIMFDKVQTSFNSQVCWGLKNRSLWPRNYTSDCLLMICISWSFILKNRHYSEVMEWKINTKGQGWTLPYHNTSTSDKQQVNEKSRS